jgi:hypothetical protein
VLVFGQRTCESLFDIDSPKDGHHGTKRHSPKEKRKNLVKFFKFFLFSFGLLLVKAYLNFIFYVFVYAYLKRLVVSVNYRSQGCKNLLVHIRD